MMTLASRVFGKITTEAKHTSHPSISGGTCCQCGRSLVMLTLVTWLRSLFVRFPCCNVFSFSIFYPRGVKLIFTGGHISLVVAFNEPSIILGLYKCNYSLTVKQELGAAAGRNKVLTGYNKVEGRIWPAGLVFATCGLFFGSQSLSPVTLRPGGRSRASFTFWRGGHILFGVFL